MTFNWFSSIVGHSGRCYGAYDQVVMLSITTLIESTNGQTGKTHTHTGRHKPQTSRRVAKGGGSTLDELITLDYSVARENVCV